VAAVLGFGTLPPKPRAEAEPFVIVPVTKISMLTAQALGRALAMGHEVVAVTVMFSDGDHTQADALRRDWDAWQPGVPLRVLRTEYASVVKPIVAFIDGERARRHEPIVVLIPVIVPTRLRHRVLHNHVEVLLSAALRTRTDLIVARVPLPLDLDDAPDTSPTVDAQRIDDSPDTAPTVESEEAKRIDRARGDR